MNLKSEMTKKELSSYYENRIMTSCKKIDKIINNLNEQIQIYNKTLKYLNKYDNTISLKYNLSKIKKITLI